MRLYGYCTGCRRFRLVLVRPSSLVLGNIPEGICHECEEREHDPPSRGRRRP